MLTIIEIRSLPRIQAQANKPASAPRENQERHMQGYIEHPVTQ